MTARARIDDLIARIDELAADSAPLTMPVTPGVLALLGEGVAYLARLIWRHHP